MGCRLVEYGHSDDWNGSQPVRLPDGSRWSFGARGNDHRKACFGSAHPEGVPDPAVTHSAPVSSTRLRKQSGTPAGVQVISCAAIRRSPPPRPPATSGYLLATLRVDRSRSE